jgi:hypothetical protein
VVAHARRGAGLLTVTALLAGALFGGGPRQSQAQETAVDGTLPGGTGIAVDIDTPVDGTSYAPGPVTVAGTASVGASEPVADTALVYVLDVSGSTGSGNGCGDNQNDDSDDTTPEDSNTVLDCEIAAARTLNHKALALGTIGEAGAAAFGLEASTADVRPARGEQLITGPATDENNTGIPDVEEVLASARYGTLGAFTPRTPGSAATNFAEAIRAATTVARASTMKRTIVIFLSDGVANAGGSVTGPLNAVPGNVNFFTFAVGAGSSCSNKGLGGEGSLDDIAAATHGACTPVPTVKDLPDVLPKVIAARLTSLTLRVDALPAAPIADVTPPLPQNGPATVGYLARTPSLAAGRHTVCVDAAGSDSGGAGSVTACHTITVNAASGQPGGTSIAVTIDAPADGAQLNQGPATVTGTASIGAGLQLSDAALVYVLDVSASTEFPEVVGCGGDQNRDGRSNLVLDCEIAAARALNDRAVAGGTLREVGAAVFAETAATADVGPFPRDQFVTGPAADLDGLGGRDIDEVLSSASSDLGEDGGGVARFTPKQVGSSTNFAEGVRKAAVVAGASGKARKIVAFLSDGVPTDGNLAEALSDVPENVDFFTFAVGAGSSCTSSGTGGEGSLQEIAEATGGTCTPVPDVAALPEVLPGLITSELTALTLRVDGQAAIPITAVAATIPRPGPVQVTYSVPVELVNGVHTLCVTAEGRDSGRAVDVTDCNVVTVRKPELTIDPLLGPRGFVVRVVGTGFPPGAVVGLSWSVGLSETPGQVTVGADGGFEAQAPIFRLDRVGSRRLVASPVSGSPFPAVTSQEFFVLPRPLQPPSFGSRR